MSNSQEQLADSVEQHLPGDLIIWIFILAELTTFAAFFLTYAFARSRNVALFHQSQLSLDLNSGAINTVLLITGSWFVVLAVQAIKRNQVRLCSTWLVAGIGCGFLFLIIKVLEYQDKFTAGLNMSTNTFYMFYFSLTFFHFMHVILGLVFLAIVLTKNLKGAYSAQNHRLVESGAAYWHMVDLLWIVLFPLVYVMR